MSDYFARNMFFDKKCELHEVKRMNVQYCVPFKEGMNLLVSFLPIVQTYRFVSKEIADVFGEWKDDQGVPFQKSGLHFTR